MCDFARVVGRHNETIETICPELCLHLLCKHPRHAITDWGASGHIFFTKRVLAQGAGYNPKQPVCIVYLRRGVKMFHTQMPIFKTAPNYFLRIIQSHRRIQLTLQLTVQILLCPRSHPCLCKVYWEFPLSSVLLNGICSIKITLHRNANQEKKN